ncbi:MAG: DUF3109 family protein [Ignavibacteriales bacterium]|nr:DUF3109 family protein [Ignavibacteriales bacterium]
MFKIGETKIEEDIAYERFACSLSDCKGACCTMAGGRGAPLIDDEVEMLHRALPAAINYLSEENKSLIEKEGIVEGAPGMYATVCLDGKDCVFVYYENEIAKCSVERAWFEGKVEFRKPISCHLFPLRVGRSDGERVRYESIAECSTARVKGISENIYLHDFIKEALVRKYGERWYAEFLEECERRSNKSLK